MEINSQEGDISITGYVAHPQTNRSHNKMQYLLLRGRFIRDRSLQHALGEAYRGLLLRGRYPICFLQIDIPADQVDVNVHPTKLEVRFRDSQRLYRQILAALRGRFLEANLNSTLQTPEAVSPVAEQTTQLPFTTATDRTGRHPGRSTPVAIHQRHSGSGIAKTDEINQAIPPHSSATDVIADLLTESTNRELTPVPAMQVMGRYLIAESDNAVIVMDQHALHESILYENLRKKVLSGPLERQPLLVPEPVDLTAEEAATLLNQRETLATLGIEIEPFGGETVLLTSLPSLLVNQNNAQLLQSLAHQLANPNSTAERRDLVDELLHMFACKAAIKAGDILADEEIQDLIAQRTESITSHHCPHGRPTTLVLTREDLDRQFLRT